MKLEPGPYKYVKVNGEYRFFSIDFDHIEKVNKGETATSAGLIAVYKKQWKFLDRWSMTLKIGAAEDDEAELSKLLGLSYWDTD